MRDLVIVGAGGHGREAVDIIDAMNGVEARYRIRGFIDDGLERGTTAEPHELEVLGGIDDLLSMDVSYVAAIGNPEVRQRVVARLPEHKPADAIHPTATIGSHVAHGSGLIMAAGSRITHSVRLGQHVHLNINATISHDCIVGNYVTITPGANISGGVTIGDRVWVGAGAAIIQSVTVGDDVTIGACAAVINDAPSFTTQVGVPAKAVLRN